MKKLEEFLPHLCIAMMLSLLVIVVLDGYNPMMRWLNSGVSKLFLVLCAIVGLVTALMLIARQRHRKKKESKNEPK